MPRKQPWLEGKEAPIRTSFEQTALSWEPPQLECPDWSVLAYYRAFLPTDPSASTNSTRINSEQVVTVTTQENR